MFMFTHFLILWSVKLIATFIMMLRPTDQMTNGYTNLLSDKLIQLWERGPFTRKRFQQLVPATNGGHGTLKSNSPLVYLLRRPKYQDSFGDLQGINSLSSFAGTNGFPNFMTITDSDLIDDVADDQSLNQNSNSIVSQLNSAVQSLGLSNLPTNLADLQGDKNQKPQQQQIAPSISVSSPSPSSSGEGGSGNTQFVRIPIGSAAFETFKPLEDYKKSLNPTGTFGHGFYGHHMHSHYPFHYPFHHHITEHDHKDHKIKYIHVPIPYPVIHVKHIKHHDNHHTDNLSPWIWGLVAAALLPILLGLLLLPLGLLFAINLFTLLAVLGGGSSFIPINGTITTGKRKRSVSSELWDEKKLDETQTFVLDCLRRF